MMKPGDLLTKHRNLFLLILLGGTLIISGIAAQEQEAATVNIPVVETAAQPVDALEAFRIQRDRDALSDIAALEKLCAQENLDESLREDASNRLQSIIDSRQAQSALEGALLNSSLYPCVAVVTGGSVTIVTGKTTITDQDAALVMTLAAAHAGASPQDVRIITAEAE